MTMVLKYWPLISFAVNAAMLWVVWSLRQLARKEVSTLVDAARASLEAADRDLDSRLDGLAGRATVVETRLEQIPTRADLARIEGEISRVGASVEAAAHGVQRLESYFLARGVEGRPS